jgi:hypothetical protein
VLGVAVACVPSLLAVIGPLLEGARPRPHLVAAALVVTAGAALVQGLGRSDAIGLAWAVGVFAWPRSPRRRPASCSVARPPGPWYGRASPCSRLAWPSASVPDSTAPSAAPVARPWAGGAPAARQAYQRRRAPRPAIPTTVSAAATSTTSKASGEPGSNRGACS